MTYPRRSILNPFQIQGLAQSCSWEPGVTSTSRVETLISDNDEILELSITETRDDGRYTHAASATLSRSEAIQLIKVLSAIT